MATGHKPFTEIILGKKSLRKRKNQLGNWAHPSSARLGPAVLGPGSARASPARLGSAPLRLARASSARLAPARHGFGRVWLSSLNLPRLRLGPVRLALDRVSPGLAWLPKWWLCANKTRLSNNHGVTGTKKIKSTGANKFHKMTGPILARLGSGQLRSSSAQLGLAGPGSARLGSPRPGLARLGPTRPGPARLGFGTVWLGSARLGCSPPRQPIFFGQPTEETG